jgi:hypothetical protein
VGGGLFREGAGLRVGDENDDMRHGRGW